MQHKKDESSLRRGNINFDILKPEGLAKVDRVESETQGGKPTYVRQKGKRGIFYQGRKQNPVKKWHIILWAFIFLLSAVAIGVLLFYGESLFWMTALPFLLLIFIWSMIMLVLFKARPR
ncbi:MAG: hypothetical protein ABUK01_06990 [Leptospirales bacterium]